MPVRLTLGDFRAPGWGELWFPLSVVLVRFSQSLCTNAVTLHQVTDVVTDQLITLPFLFWCVWLFVCFGFACGFGWFFVCFVVCFVCVFSVDIVTANRTLYILFLLQFYF